MTVLVDADSISDPTSPEQMCWSFAEAGCGHKPQDRHGRSGFQAGIKLCVRVQTCKFCSEFWPQPSTPSLGTFGSYVPLWDIKFPFIVSKEVHSVILLVLSLPAPTARRLLHSQEPGLRQEGFGWVCIPSRRSSGVGWSLTPYAT